jgi:hypothetical protein
MPNDLQGHATKGNAVQTSPNLNFRPLTVRRAVVVRTAARDATAAALPDFIQATTGLQVMAPAAGMTSFAHGATDSPEGLSMALPVRANELHWLWLSQEALATVPQPLVAEQFDQVLARSRGDSLLHAVELTDAHCAFDLRGSQAHAVLQRLADVLSFPPNDLGFTRLRLVDIPASLIRLAIDHYVIVADVHLVGYVREWVLHAVGGMGGAHSITPL